MDESLWPARNVAEYAYCPRLFYFMEVEGIHLPSDDTETGNRVHRRVDAPSNEAVVAEAAAGDAPKAIRSLTLTSPKHRLTATLDLAELDGAVAVPVEYRKGRPRRIVDGENGNESSFEPWPTDRVQVGLQAVLLEEAGYQVPRCVVYYAAEKRRVTLTFDDALRSEALATLAAARECATGPRPLPLVNDARCPRCSLQPICLPDEVTFERSTVAGTLRAPPAAEPPADDRESVTPPSSPSPLTGVGRGEGVCPAAPSTIKPRQIWPPRDDGLHLVAQQDGVKVGVQAAALIVTDREGRRASTVPLANVESLSILGGVQISTQAIQTLADRGIPIAFLSAAGRLTAMIDPLDSVSAQVRTAQVRRFDDPACRLALSRALVAAKIQNQRTLLMRNHEQLPPRLADDLAAQAESALQADSIDSVRGHEGQAAALYFGNFAGMIRGELSAEFDVNGRRRRPPPDPINSALSFAYSMLTHECVASLRTARLEPSIGAFHVSRPGRPALALDLMEPFRPLLADSIVITAFNRGELKPGHFLRTAAGCAFTDAGRKAFFAVYGRRMADEITHPVYNYKLSYRRMLILHARLIAAWLLGEVPGLSFLTTR